MNETIMELQSGDLEDLRQALQRVDGELIIYGYEEEGILVPLTTLCYSTEYEEFTLEAETEERNADVLTVAYFFSKVLRENLPNKPVYVWEEDGGKMNPVGQLMINGDKVILIP